MHVVVRKVGERILTSSDTAITVLAVRDGAVLFGIEPAAATEPDDGAAMPGREATPGCGSSGG